MSNHYDELMDDLDCAVFSGELLETNIDDLEYFVLRWKRAIEQHRKTIEVEAG